MMNLKVKLKDRVFAGTEVGISKLQSELPCTRLTDETYVYEMKHVRDS